MSYPKFRDTLKEIIILDEWVEFTWGKSGHVYYENLGYTRGKEGEKFYVHISDVSPNSNKRIVKVCPLCGDEIETSVLSVMKSGHSLCQRCANTEDITGIKFNMLTAIEPYFGEDAYFNGSYWIWECECGEEVVIRKNSVVTGYTHSCGCYAIQQITELGKRASEWKLGSSSPFKDNSISYKERLEKRNLPEYAHWRKLVYERDHYTCQKCGDKTGGNLVAHHMYSYKYYEEYAFLPEFGVSLCRTCHKDFHINFMGGWRVECTPNDYYEWLDG